MGFLAKKKDRLSRKPFLARYASYLKDFLDKLDIYILDNSHRLLRDTYRMAVYC